MPNANQDMIVIGAINNPVEGKVVAVPSHHAIDEKLRLAATDAEVSKNGALDIDIKAAPALDDRDDFDKEKEDHDIIIITGADAANHLLPLRDDHEPALTFRGIFLATCLSAFQAVMTQIYQVIDIRASDRWMFVAAMD